MELPVLAEQVPVAQRSGVEVPDAHGEGEMVVSSALSHSVAEGRHPRRPSAQALPDPG
jgi:hypothetical protein